MPETGISKFLLKTKSDLTFETYHGGSSCKVKSLINSSGRCIKYFNRWSILNELIRYLTHMKCSHKQEIILNHCASMEVNVGAVKYSNETIFRGLEYYATSRSCYSKLREDYDLPSNTTLQRLTSIVKKMNDLNFFKSIFSKLDTCHQKMCVLIIDEVYVKSVLEYHGGNIFGEAANNPGMLANTLLSFMVVRQFGGPRFICKMLPVKQLDSEFLNEQTILLIEELRGAGADVIAILTDGNR